MPISRPIQIFPNDINPNVAIGVDIPFNRPGVFSPNYQTKDAIRNNLINFFLTNKGERFMNPNFGGGLREYIFSQISDSNIETLTEDIQLKLQTNFSRLIVEDLQIFADETKTNSLTVLLKYKIQNTNIVDNITIDFNQ